MPVKVATVGIEVDDVAIGWRPHHAGKYAHALGVLVPGTRQTSWSMMP